MKHFANISINKMSSKITHEHVRKSLKPFATSFHINYIQLICIFSFSYFMGYNSHWKRAWISAAHTAQKTRWFDMTPIEKIREKSYENDHVKSKWTNELNYRFGVSIFHRFYTFFGESVFDSRKSREKKQRKKKSNSDFHSLMIRARMCS